jgi:hypothetical protein
MNVAEADTEFADGHARKTSVAVQLFQLFGDDEIDQVLLVDQIVEGLMMLSKDEITLKLNKKKIHDCLKNTLHRCRWCY